MVEARGGIDIRHASGAVVCGRRVASGFHGTVERVSLAILRSMIRMTDPWESQLLIAELLVYHFSVLLTYFYFPKQHCVDVLVLDSWFLVPRAQVELQSCAPSPSSTRTGALHHDDSQL